MISDEILATALSAVRGIKVTSARGYNVSPADTIRAALTAALPLIRAGVVEECAKRYEQGDDWDTFSAAAAAIRKLGSAV